MTGKDPNAKTSAVGVGEVHAALRILGLISDYRAPQPDRELYPISPIHPPHELNSNFR
jgi:hypothetical protein